MARLSLVGLGSSLLFAILLPHQTVAAANTCSSQSNLFQCPGAPDGFCCPTGNQCVNLNGASTVLCCPDGQDCKIIVGIPCDIPSLNATLFPANQVHSLDSTPLQTCGQNHCCPGGYSCKDSSGAGVCVQNSNTVSSASPSRSATASFISLPPRTSSLSVTQTSATAAPISSNGTAPSGFISQKSKTSSGAIAGIVIGSLLAAALFIFLLVVFLRRRVAARHFKTSSPLSFYDKTPQSPTPAGQRYKISDPIFHPELSSRSEFLGHARTDSSSGSTGRHTGNTVLHTQLWPTPASNVSSARSANTPHQHYQHSPQHPSTSIPTPPAAALASRAPLGSPFSTPGSIGATPRSKLPKLSIDTSSPLPRVRSLFHRSMTPSLSPLQKFTARKAARNTKTNANPATAGSTQPSATDSADPKSRRASQETIDILMPAPTPLPLLDGLPLPPPPGIVVDGERVRGGAPPPGPGDSYREREKRMTAQTTLTTFSGIMAKGGYTSDWNQKWKAK